MNERSLDEVVAQAIDRLIERGVAEEDIPEQVLQDPDLRILLDGYRMHDRSEGLEDVIIRDIRRKVDQLLQVRREG